MRRMRNDLTIYDQVGDRWWDTGDRTFASLRRVNEFHFAQIDGWAGQHGDGLRGRRVVVDRSARSLLCASAHAGLGRCAFVRADLTRTPLADASADVVLLADVVEHIRDSAAGLREAGRLLRAGGLAFVTTINRTWRARALAVTLGEGLPDRVITLRPSSNIAVGYGALLRRRGRRVAVA